MVMEISPSATACQPRDSKSSSPKQTPHGDDILLDTFFDHSQQLDSTAFDALLDTTFDTADDDTTSTSASVSTVKAARQSPQSDTKLQQPSSSIASRMALFNTESDVAMQTSSSDPSFTTLPSHVHGLQLNTTSGYHGMPAHAYPTNNYEQLTMAQRSLPLRLHGLPNDVSHEHYYSNPVGLPSSGSFAPTMIPQHQDPAFHTSHHVEQRQPTAGLLDYDNMIPEEDDMDENVNGDVADPCYAQLLYRCLLEAQDHTMSLKDIYNWVFRHSQKARDSTSTGWQNSVRHNLSMNAVGRPEASMTFSSTHNLLTSHRPSSESLPLFCTALRKALSGASPTARSKKASSPLLGTAKIPSASQSAAHRPLSSARSPVQKAGRRLVQPLRTEGPCRPERPARNTTAESSDTTVVRASKKQHTSHRPPCLPQTTLQPHLSGQCGFRTAWLHLPSPTTSRSLQALTSYSRWKTMRSARSRTPASPTHTLRTKSKSAMTRHQRP